MKAISLWQPWASLIACGAKIYETRDYPPPRALIGQTIAIHAAKHVDKETRAFAEEMMYGQHTIGSFNLAERLEATWSKADDALYGFFGMACIPVGCVVCTARLDAAYQCGQPLFHGALPPRVAVVRSMLSDQKHARDTIYVDEFGNYAPGRWAWLLSDVRVMNPPAPVKGKQGFFDLPQGWMTEAL